jgi:DNA-directed RNA polymerase subunit RPC12/RpoP
MGAKGETNMRMGKVYISTEYVVDLDDESMVAEAKIAMIEDLESSIKFDELSAWVKVKEDSNLSKSDIPEFLKDEDEPEDECVEIIASGYEWTCSHCETLNNEIEITTYVICSKCRRKFFVYDHHHAHG